MSRLIQGQELHNLHTLLATAPEESIMAIFETKLRDYFKHSLFFSEAVLADQRYKGMRVLMMSNGPFKKNRVFLEAQAGWFEVDENASDASVLETLNAVNATVAQDPITAIFNIFF